MLLSDSHYQKSDVLELLIPYLTITSPLCLVFQCFMYDYKESTEYENDVEVLFQELYIKSGPTKQPKICQNELYRTNILRLFAFIELICFET